MPVSSSQAFVTCDMCDDHKNDSSGDFRVLPPVFRNFGGAVKFSGAVSTVRCFEDNTLAKAALDSAGEGRVLVVDGGASMRHALLGDNLGAAAVRNGWAGIVINGCVRDVAQIAVLPLGVRALACIPMPPRKENHGERDVAVQIQGAWVRPGDWLYADEDGMLVTAAPL